MEQRPHPAAAAHPASDDDDKPAEPSGPPVSSPRPPPTRRHGGRRGVRMAEFFSGIGGMRCGVERALSSAAAAEDGAHPRRVRSPLRSCAAYEISLHAKRTYALNFSDGRGTGGEGGDGFGGGSGTGGGEFIVLTKLVEQLRPSDVDGRFDLWTMSPPCQPFTTTRGARRRDVFDRRTDGFRGIMRLLDAVVDKPRWLLLENVKGFVGSDVLGMWYDCLERNGYSWREYLLNPTQVGVPNNRTRYFMVCERSDRFRPGGGPAGPRSCPCPRGNMLITAVPGATGLAFGEGMNGDEGGTREVEVLPLSHFIGACDDADDGDDDARYFLPDETLRSDWARDLPIVSRHDRITHCFTAAYGRVLHRATGSLLLAGDGVDSAVPVAERPVDRSDLTRYSGMVRRFKPRELLALFGFPPGFDFPEDLSLEHRYKLIGNSVNVYIVARVAAELLRNCTGEYVN